MIFSNNFIQSHRRLNCIHRFIERFQMIQIALGLPVVFDVPAENPDRRILFGDVLNFLSDHPVASKDRSAKILQLKSLTMSVKLTLKKLTMLTFVNLLPIRIGLGSARFARISSHFQVE